MYCKYFFSKKEPPVEETGPEQLYVSMLTVIPQYMIALLKILLAAAPSSKVCYFSLLQQFARLPEKVLIWILHVYFAGENGCYQHFMRCIDAGY